jgi:ABC-type Na+ efflux pump permease subunit
MRALTIARSTCREALHLPVLHVIGIGSVVLLAIVGQLPRFTLSIYDDIKMLKDLAIATASLCGMLVAVFTAVHVITSEIENWTVVTVLSKPVRRWEFVVGKFLGLVWTLVALFAVLSVSYILVVWWGMYSSIVEYQGIYPELKRNFWAVAWGAADEMWRAMVFCLLQVVVLSAVAVACCVRAPMIISVVTFFVTFILGHFVEPLAKAAERSGTAIGGGVGIVLSALVPDLESLNFSQEIGTGRLIGAGLMGWGVLYATVYASALVLVAVLLFRNREVI